MSTGAAVEGDLQICITLKLALIYPRSCAPADLDIILCICQALNGRGIKPHDVTVVGHEISKNPNFQSEELNQMKRFVTILATALLSAVLTVAFITACGGNGSGSGGTGPLAGIFTFNPNPVGLHGNKNPVATRLAQRGLQAIVEAQSPTPGGGNFSGFCNTLDIVSARAAAVIFGIGRWSTADCPDGTTPDTDVGVTIPQNGQIGNLTVDAVGTGTGTDSGQMEVKIIHADGSQAITQITCTLGISSNAKVHCEDTNAAHHTNVNAGDQVSARIFWDPGDTYRAVRVNIVYATPTF